MASRVVLGLTISAVLLYLAARNVDPTRLVVLIGETHLGYLGVSAAFTIFAIWLRAWRWRFLIPEHGHIKTSNLFTATMIGYMGNNLFPLRIGDFARAYIAARREQASASAFLATVVVERLLDVLSILAILGILFFFVPFPPWLSKGSALLLGVSLLALICLLTVKTYRAPLGLFIERKFSRPSIKWLAAISHSFFEGLNGLEADRALLISMLITVPLWAAYALATYAALQALHLDVPVVASWVVLAFVGVGVSLPSAPGFIGTFQFFAVAALSLFAVEEQKAFGFSLVFHASQFIPVTLFGWLLLLKQHMSLADLAAFKKPAARTG